MNRVCREEFNKAKELIKLRKESMGNNVKPTIQNLDSGILLQFFENWEDIVEKCNEKKIDLKRRVFELVDNNSSIVDVTMYFTNEIFNIKNFILKHDVIYLNLDGSFDIETDNHIYHIKPFSVIKFKRGDKLTFKNIDSVNYIISIKYDSPII